MPDGTSKSLGLGRRGIGTRLASRRKRSQRIRHYFRFLLFRTQPCCAHSERQFHPRFSEGAGNVKGNAMYDKMDSSVNGLR